jgi:hypothetical protein
MLCANQQQGSACLNITVAGLGAGFAYLAIESGKLQQALAEEQRTQEALDV